MLVHAKKVTCLTLLAELASAPIPLPQRIGSPTTIPFLTTGDIDTLFACLYPDIYVQISGRRN